MDIRIVKLLDELMKLQSSLNWAFYTQELSKENWDKASQCIAKIEELTLKYEEENFNKRQSE